MLSACAIPGIWPYTSDDVEKFIGAEFTNDVNQKINPEANDFCSLVAKGSTWLYDARKESGGIRYYIRYYPKKCWYSLLVNDNNVIISWRDEGGSSHMNKCFLH